MKRTSSGRASRAAGLLSRLLAALVLAAGPAAAQTSPLADVRVTMRDGVALSADVYLPADTGRFATVLLRTPYDNGAATYARYGLENYVRAGYAVVLQSTRGQGRSGGEFDFYFPEASDGYDTIAWIARQPWSDGRVAMDGGSYLGTVQWLAARERPRGLRCIIPTAPSGRLFDELPYVGGAFAMGWALGWIRDRFVREPPDSSLDMNQVYTHRPLLTMDEHVGGPVLPLYRRMLEHATLGAYWKPIQLDAGDFASLDIPALTVTGWFDGDQAGALHYWAGMRAHSPARDRQHLIIGPWNHQQTYLGGGLTIGAFKFTPESVLDIQRIRLDFLDACLGDRAPAMPRARVYVTGSNEWLELVDYPPPEATARALYLRSGGRANGGEGDGALSWSIPGDEPPDRFRYDPRDPVPHIGGATDRRRVHERADVLVYTTEPLAEPLVVIGQPVVRLYAASDARDTDFTAKLIDVHPDGRAVNLTSTGGVIRARYRHGYAHEVPLEPGRTTEFTIELHQIGHAFLAGHRIQLEVSSSAYPYVNPNQNTGNPVATDTEWRIAYQTVIHTRERPSHVLLPVMPR